MPPELGPAISIVAEPEPDPSGPVGPSFDDVATLAALAVLAWWFVRRFKAPKDV